MNDSLNDKDVHKNLMLENTKKFYFYSHVCNK